MSHYVITVNEGPMTAEDNATYFVNEDNPPEFTVHVIEDEPRIVFRQIKFIPTNGRREGLIHVMPYERLVSIVEPADA